jgi:malonyl-CoA/methylmalonyl-CoA synthetase
MASVPSVNAPTGPLVAASTVPAAVAVHVRERPDAVVLTDARGATRTWHQVATQAEVIATSLRGLGVGGGDRVVLSCAPSMDVVSAYLGIWLAGGVVVPANTGYTAREVAHLVTDARPTAVIVDDERAGLWRDAGATATLAPQVVAPPMDPLAAADRLAESVRPESDALIGYTSGTTGAPKGAVLTHANVIAGARAVVEAWGWTPDDTLILALPLFHMHGLGVGVTGTLVAGARAVVLEAFSPDGVLDAIAQHGGTMFFGVPTMYTRLLRSPRVGELSALRLAVSGSAPLAAEVSTALAEQAGVEVLERYGMSETMMLTSNLLAGPRRPGRVGVPLPGVEVRLGEGDVVEVRGPSVFRGYLGRPDATADAFTADGWFRTGDVGAFDDDGSLALVGRASELIISGGYNVYPREVEDVLCGLPGVREAAVVGVPDAEWGEQVVAFLVLNDATSVDALLQDARSRLAAYKVPRKAFVVASLPRNAMGKVVRSDLARLAVDDNTAPNSADPGHEGP